MRRPMRPQISSRTFSNENDEYQATNIVIALPKNKYILICIDNFNGSVIESRGY